MRAFIQVQAGAARFTSSLEIVDAGSASQTEFALQPGAGLDVPLTENVAARVMVDYRHIFTDVEDPKEVRVAGGIVVALGNR